MFARGERDNRRAKARKVASPSPWAARAAAKPFSMCRERPCTLRGVERRPEQEILVEGTANAIPNAQQRGAHFRG